jgi:hypothetical protein
MRKIIVKLPDKNMSKFRLQRKGWVGRRYVKATGVLNRLESLFPSKELREKTAVVVKEHNGSHFENINESVASNDPKYLLHTLSCFLEDYLSPSVLKKYSGAII